MKKNFSFKGFKKSVSRISRKGKRFTAKHQYGLFFSALTFVTIMVGINEYMIRSNEAMVSAVHSIQSQTPAISASNLLSIKQEVRKPAVTKKNR